MKNSFKISKLMNKVILARAARKKIRGGSQPQMGGDEFFQMGGNGHFSSQMGGEKC